MRRFAELRGFAAKISQTVEQTVNKTVLALAHVYAGQIKRDNVETSAG